MKRAINLGVICAFVFGFTLAASPGLHEQIHGAAPHECAATLIASGNYEHSAPPVVVVRPVAFERFAVVDLGTVFVWPLFLSASLLEHAPPALA